MESPVSFYKDAPAFDFFTLSAGWLAWPSFQMASACPSAAVIASSGCKGACRLGFEETAQQHGPAGVTENLLRKFPGE